MLYTIGRFAARTGLTARALRFYDGLGLLPARRDPTNDHRYYRDADLLPARRIALLRALGFSLPNIADLLSALEDPDDAKHLRAAFLEQIDGCAAERTTLGQREESLRTTLRLLESSESPAAELSRLAALSDDPRSELMTAFRTRSSRVSAIGERAHNQDHAWNQTLENGGIYIVADGMGPDGRGAEASRVACEVIAEQLEFALLTPSEWSRHLTHLVQEAHAAVQPLGDGVATTLALLVVHERTAFIASVGDSRVLRLEGLSLVPLTRDHSVVRELIDEGSLAAEDAASHPQAHMLTSAVGGDAAPHVHLHSETVHPGTRFLLATDGVTRVLAEARLAELVAESGGPDAVAARIVAEADGEDNATAVVVEA